MHCSALKPLRKPLQKWIHAFFVKWIHAFLKIFILFNSASVLPNFSWIELQMLLRCCLIHISIIILRNFLHLLYLCSCLDLGLFMSYLCVNNLLMILLYTIYWCYTIDTIQLIDTNVLIIRSLYINKSFFFIYFLLITFSDFGSLEGVLKTTYVWKKY